MVAEARTFERAAPPHLPHLPSPRLQDRRAVFYAPCPVPTADVVTRSDLIGWGTPPASPPAPDQAQSLSDPTSAHIPYGAQQSLHPQLEEAYPPTVPQVQQNAWNGAPSAGDGAPQDGGPTQLADSLKAGAPQVRPTSSTQVLADELCASIASVIPSPGSHSCRESVPHEVYGQAAPRAQLWRSSLDGG